MCAMLLDARSVPPSSSFSISRPSEPKHDFLFNLLNRCSSVCRVSHDGLSFLKCSFQGCLRIRVSRPYCRSLTVDNGDVAECVWSSARMHACSRPAQLVSSEQRALLVSTQCCFASWSASTYHNWPRTPDYLSYTRALKRGINQLSTPSRARLMVVLICGVGRGNGLSYICQECPEWLQTPTDCNRQNVGSVLEELALHDKT